MFSAEVRDAGVEALDCVRSVAHIIVFFSAPVFRAETCHSDHVRIVSFFLGMLTQNVYRKLECECAIVATFSLQVLEQFQSGYVCVSHLLFENPE